MEEFFKSTLVWFSVELPLNVFESKLEINNLSLSTVFYLLLYTVADTMSWFIQTL